MSPANCAAIITRSNTPPGPFPASMAVPVMDVWLVRVLVRQHLVPMPVQMRPGAVPGRIVLMLVVFVMPVGMRMRQRLMAVLMFVPLAQVQPDSQHHDRRGQPEGRRGATAVCLPAIGTAHGFTVFLATLS